MSEVVPHGAEDPTGKYLHLAGPDRKGRDLEEAVERHFEEAKNNPEHSFLVEFAQRAALAGLARCVYARTMGITNKLGLDPWEQAQYACKRAADEFFYPQQGDKRREALLPKLGSEGNRSPAEEGFPTEEYTRFARAGFWPDVNDFQTVATPEIVALAVAVAARACYRFGLSCVTDKQEVHRRIIDRILSAQ